MGSDVLPDVYCRKATGCGVASAFCDSAVSGFCGSADVAARVVSRVRVVSSSTASVVIQCRSGQSGGLGLGLAVMVGMGVVEVVKEAAAPAIELEILAPRLRSAASFRARE